MIKMHLLGTKWIKVDIYWNVWTLGDDSNLPQIWCIKRVISWEKSNVPWSI